MKKQCIEDRNRSWLIQIYELFRFDSGNKYFTYKTKLTFEKNPQIENKMKQIINKMFHNTQRRTFSSDFKNTIVKKKKRKKFFLINK